MTTSIVDVDLTAEITSICEKLGVFPADVRRLDIAPRQIIVETYKKNENGNKYVDLDSGEAAVESETFALRWTA